MYLCQAYGLNILSDIPLLNDEKVADFSENYDVKVTLEEIEEPFESTDKSIELFCFLPNVAHFLISNGKHIQVDPFPEITEQMLRNCILGSAMAILLQQRGSLVLHASCVAIDGVAVAFLGHSGAGKSTLCSAFYARGHKFLTDDVMSLSITSQGVTVIPSIPEIKLRSDSSSVVGFQGGSLSPLHLISQKRIHQIDRGFHNQPLLLKQIYILDSAEQNQIQALSTQAGFVELIRHTRAVKTLKEQNLEQNHFNKCTLIVKSVPIFRLTRKFALSELHSVVSLVEQNLAEVNL